MQDESHDHGHVHFVPQNTVFFDVRTRRPRRRGQTEGFYRTSTITITITINVLIIVINSGQWWLLVINT